MYNIKINEEEKDSLFVVLKFMIRNFYNDDEQDPTGIQLRLLRDKISNAEQE
tara:strand:+ start:695 stop:850 length:156 start_codon:yes stop_codon:yes gene_type:complete